MLQNTVSQPLRSAETADDRRLLWLKSLVIAYGLLSIALAFCAQFVGPLLQASMTILGIIGGPMLAVFTVGILVPYANQKVSSIQFKYDVSRRTCRFHRTSCAHNLLSTDFGYTFKPDRRQLSVQMPYPLTRPYRIYYDNALHRTWR